MNGIQKLHITIKRHTGNFFGAYQWIDILICAGIFISYYAMLVDSTMQIEEKLALVTNWIFKSSVGADDRVSFAYLIRSNKVKNVGYNIRLLPVLVTYLWNTERKLIKNVKENYI